MSERLRVNDDFEACAIQVLIGGESHEVWLLMRGEEVVHNEDNRMVLFASLIEAVDVADNWGNYAARPPDQT